MKKTIEEKIGRVVYEGNVSEDTWAGVYCDKNEVWVEWERFGLNQTVPEVINRSERSIIIDLNEEFGDKFPIPPKVYERGTVKTKEQMEELIKISAKLGRLVGPNLFYVDKELGLKFILTSTGKCTCDLRTYFDSIENPKKYGKKVELPEEIIKILLSIKKEYDKYIVKKCKYLKQEKEIRHKELINKAKKLGLI